MSFDIISHMCANFCYCKLSKVGKIVQTFDTILTFLDMNLNEAEAGSSAGEVQQQSGAKLV